MHRIVQGVQSIKRPQALKKTKKVKQKIFLEPPTEPREPGITDFDNKSVTLLWNKPVDDGGRPITHFVIQKKDQFGGIF